MINTLEIQIESENIVDGISPTLVGGGEAVILPAVNGLDTLAVDISSEDLSPFILEQKKFNGIDISGELVYNFLEEMVSRTMINRKVYEVENFYTIYKYEILNLYDDCHDSDSVKQNILLHQYNCFLNDAIFKIVNRYFNFRDNPSYIDQIRIHSNNLVRSLFIENAVSDLDTALIDINLRIDNLEQRYCSK